jgi:sec-independent protein translocase protein TatA
MLHVVVAEIIGWELLLVLAVVALLFGSARIPKLAKSIGQARKEFQKGLDEPADEQAKPDSDT